MSEENSNKTKGQQPDALQCSFCGAAQHEVRKLVGGHGVYICDACVQTCADLMREDDAAAPPPTNSSWKRVYPPAATT